MEHKIGEIFEFNDNGKIVALKIEEFDGNCAGCYFCNKRLCFDIPETCSEHAKTDNKGIYFKRVDMTEIKETVQKETISVTKEELEMLQQTFKSIVESSERLTSGNVSHQAPNLRIMAVNGQVLIDKLLNGQRLYISK